MTTKAVKALFWKEYRQQIMLLVALLIICVVVQAVCYLMSLFPNSLLLARDFIPPYLTIAMLFTALYAAGAAAILFTVEHEDRTFQFLRMLPVGGGTVLVGKVAWLLVSTLALGTLLLLESAIWCRVVESSDSAESVIGLMGVAVVEALCWGLFWTTRCRSQLYSILLTFISVSLASNLVVNLMPRSDYGDVVAAYSAAAGFRLLLAGVVGAIALWDAKKWLQKRVRESRSAAKTRTLSEAGEKTLSAPPKRGEFRALLWQAFRQSPKMIIAMPVFSCALLCVLVASEISRTSLGQLSFELSFFVLTLGLVFPMIYSASVFFRDQQCSRAAMLTNMGVSPGKFWASRILLFGGVYLTLPLAIICYRLFWGFYTFSHGSTMPEVFFAALSSLCEEDTAVMLLGSLSVFCVGQLCSLLTRSLPIAFVLTIGGTALCLMGVVLMEIYRVSWSLMLFPIFGMLLATRLRTADWMRGRDNWRAFVRPMAAIVVPFMLVIAMVPMIRIYSVPNISLGYALSPDTRGMMSPDIVSERYNRLVERLNENLDDIPYAQQTWLEIQAMSGDASCPNYYANNTAIIDSASRAIGQNVDEDEFGQEYLRDAIKFLGRMPETAVPPSECIKRFFDARLYDLNRDVIQFRSVLSQVSSYSEIDEVRFERTDTIPRWIGRFVPWEYARTRRVWNDLFQTQAYYADVNSGGFYRKETLPVNWGEFERYANLSEEKIVRQNRAPGTFQAAMFGNESLPPASSSDMETAETERLLSIARCAVKLWWLETGELPETIAQLECEYLEKSPIFEVVLIRTAEEGGFPTGDTAFTPYVATELRNKEIISTSSAGPSAYTQSRKLRFLQNEK